MPENIILASSSPYRRALLARLGLEFTCQSPEIDESRQPQETAQGLVLRLSREKARKVQAENPEAIIIGSDQVAVIESEILGKPGSESRAIEQLMRSRDKTVAFLTGLCVIKGDIELVACIPYSVTFRHFSREEAERYVSREQPLNCAGSFKSEGLGVTLFRSQAGDDPTSLIGLPLIKTCEFLRQLGLQLP